MTNRRASLTLMMLTGAMVACGGGGGGGGDSTPAPPPSTSPPPPSLPPPSPPPPPPASPPVNTTPPTASIASIAPTQRVIQQTVTFAGTGTTPVANAALSYAWSFGDGATGTGATATHQYSAHGSYTVTLTVMDPANLTTTATQNITVLAPPATPTVTVDDFSITPSTTIHVTAGATDPQGSALTYSWDFGDGATAAGTTASHTYAIEGSFPIRVTVTNGFGLTSTSSSAPVQVAWLPMVRPGVVIWNSEHLSGQTLFSQSAFLEPNNLPYTLDYSFGDGTTVRSTDANQLITHTYTSTGDYTVRVVATNSAGHSVEGTRAVSVRAVAPQPAVNDNEFQPFCAGAYCGAASASNYSGSGVGIWRYHNATGADATIDIAITGVTPRSPATLLFSNGKATAAPSVPATGTQSAAVSKRSPPRMASLSGLSHESLVEQNRLAGMASRSAAGPQPIRAPASKSGRAVAHAAVPVGTTRIWRETYTGQDYNMVVAASCAFTTGRSGVVWVDAARMQRGEIDPARVANITTALCGPAGAYELMVAYHGGDFWGPAPAQWIQDGATPQDLHIVIPDVPQGTSFGGYFASFNLNNPSVDPTSNAALAVVLNGWYFANAPVDDVTQRSTLVHELQHLMNFYRRNLLAGRAHAGWLEETSAMIAEDFIGARVSPQPRTEARVGGYMYSGGGIGYLGWTHPDGNSYNQGGSFGTFLLRRYGATLSRELMDCDDHGDALESLSCVQDFIVAHGGAGFEDEFARMGASALAAVPTSGAPFGFGFPGVTVGGAAIKPLGSYISPDGLDDPPRDLNGTFGATTHTYSRTFIAPGQSTYSRQDVVVPAGTTLLLVIAEPVD